MHQCAAVTLPTISFYTPTTPCMLATHVYVLCSAMRDNAPPCPTHHLQVCPWSIELDICTFCIPEVGGIGGVRGGSGSLRVAWALCSLLFAIVVFGRGEGRGGGRESSGRGEAKDFTSPCPLLPAMVQFERCLARQPIPSHFTTRHKLTPL